MYLVKRKIAPEVSTKDLKISVEVISLISQKFELNTNTYKIGVVIDGAIDLMYNDKTTNLVKEDLFLINPGKVYGIAPANKDNLILVLNISESYILKKFPNRTSGPYLSLETIENKEEFLLDIYRLVKMYCYEMGVGVQGFLQEIDRVVENLITFNELEKNKFLNTWIRVEAIEKMKEIFDFPENQPKLSEISKQYNLKSSFLSKTFKNILGYSFVDACHMAQINKAIELLMKTDRGILDIAFDCGFSSTKTFHENFKKYLKETPNSFRKKILLFEKKYTYTCFNRVLKSETLKTIMDGKEQSEYQKKLKITYEIFADERCLNVTGKDFSEKSIFSASSLGPNWIKYIPEIQKKIGFKKVQIELKIQKDDILIRHGVDVWNLLNENSLSEDIQFIDQIDIQPLVVLKIEKDEHLDTAYRMVGRFLDILCKLVRISRMKLWCFELDISSFWKNGVESSVEHKCNLLYRMWYDIISSKTGIKNMGVHLGAVENIRSEKFIKFIERIIFSVRRPRFISINLTDSDIYSENINPGEFIAYVSGLKSELEKYTKRYSRKDEPEIDSYISAIRILDYYNMVPNKYHEMVSALGNMWGLMWYIKCGIPVATVEYFNKKYKSKKEFEENLDVHCRKVAIFNRHSIKNSDFYVFQFISGLESQILRLEDGIIATTNGEDYKIILFQDMGENIQYIFDKNSCLKEYPGKEIKLIIKGLEGKYKLKISTLRTEKGTMHYESNKLGEIEELDLNDIEYLKNKVIPKMEIEKINLKGEFERDFKLNLFEIKCIELIRLG